MKQLLFVFLIGGLLAGCVQSEEYLSVTPVIIAQGNLMGNGSEQLVQQTLTISDSVSWNQLIAQMNTVNNVSGDFLETHIDFSKYTILAIFDQVRPSGGYSMDINIVENAKSVSVDIVNKKPLGYAAMISVMTQPYLIVKIPRTTKSVLFNW